jgi:transcriptional regulator with XRE-family HTH domain
MTLTTPLGEFLRARRELIRPGDVGLSDGGRRRRVPGLRREELAMLAGISPNYYVRLEQGRDHRPSAQVVDALARALQLDADATAHLHFLAQPAPSRRHPEEPERAPLSIEQLIGSWPLTPAFVHDRHLNVLAANALNLALCPVFRPGVNLLRALFVDSELRNLYDDWEDVAFSAVARVRVLVGRDVDDPDLVELVSELSVCSDEFRRLWGRHDIQVRAAHRQVFNHPVVGRIELQPERLAIAGTNAQMLIVRHAEPGSPSERALQRLGRLVAEGHAQSVPVSGRETGGLANPG